MSMAGVAAIVYGLLSILGGILGYVKAKSRVSLISGLISGVALVGSGVLSVQGLVWAKGVAIVLTVVLILVFGVRLQKTRKWMPAGLMVGLGIAALIIMLGT